MKLTYLARYSRLGPSSRYRIFQFEELYKNAGIDFQAQVLFDDAYFRILREPASSLKKPAYIFSRYRERMRFLDSNPGQDLVIVEHQLFPWLPVWMEKQHLPERYLLEFDDAIYLKHPRKMPELLKRAEGVIAGNRILSDYASQFNASVHLVPTVLNTDVFKPATKQPSDKIRIGWSGLEYNFQYLKPLVPVFLNLLRKYPVEIVILSGSAPREFQFPFRFVKWDADREVEQISQFDIGVMPLRNDGWSRGKCGMKLLQFMSLEVPAVASPVGVNVEILTSGRNGMLADTPGEWESRLAALIEDAALRTAMGKAAREKVVADYSVDGWFPRLRDLVLRFSGK